MKKYFTLTFGQEDWCLFVKHTTSEKERDEWVKSGKNHTWIEGKVNKHDFQNGVYHN